ncbi:MAG: magnesium/cobalt transporter CorA [Candidatus Micrarchaeota archaeon]
MSKYGFRGYKRVGQPPGTPVYKGSREGKVKITLIDYDSEKMKEREITDLTELKQFKQSPTVTWLNVDGIHNTEVIQKIGEIFNLHPLLMEDILNTDQRPKLEDYESYLFLIVKMAYWKERDLESEQISFILGDNYVISFQEREGDVFDGIRERIRKAKGRIRSLGADYLAYCLMDSVVNNYFDILEKLGEEMDGLEELILNDPTLKSLEKLHHLKSETVFLKRSIWPMRELIGTLQRGDSKLVKKITAVYFRDLYDHAIQISEVIETFRETLTEIREVHLSGTSNKLNEVMKTLTIIATIFIPLTFVVGVYGMNFRHMPELEVPWAYPAVWGVMILMGAVMLLYFKLKKWF